MGAQCFDSETFTMDGEDFRAEYYEDDYTEAPWEREDGHGPVRYLHVFRRGMKRPGEIVLHDSYRDGVWLYDFAAAMRKARAEGWDAKPYGEGTPGQRAERAVKRDASYLSAFLSSEWAYVQVRVIHVRSGDDDWLGGVESFQNYHKEAAREIARELAARHTMTREDFETCMGWD